MKDQHKKIELLRSLGVSEDLEAGCDHQTMAEALGLSKPTWSSYAKRDDYLPLPLKHQAKLGELYGFDHTSPEWLEREAGAFRAKYLEEHGRGDRPSAQTIVKDIEAEEVEAGDIVSKNESGSSTTEVSNIKAKKTVKLGNVGSFAEDAEF